VRYRLHKMGFGSGERAFATEGYEWKGESGSSHRRVLDLVARRPAPARVLDLGCGEGLLAKPLTAAGYYVVGVDGHKADGAGDAFAEFVEADLEQGVPDEVGGGFDLVLAADVLEHVRHPEQLLLDARARLAPGGSLLVSVPNFAHWYPRARVAVGRFDYDRQGILDRTHLRFFTRASFERLARRCGFTVKRRDYTGLPLDVLDRGGEVSGSRAARSARAVDKAGVAVWPTLFGYQLLYELMPEAAPNDGPPPA
jgi:SAM-dependent methyltransferase